MANWAWPEIIDEDSARDAAHKAGGWAAFVAGLTALLAVISMTSGVSVMGVNSWSLIDAALFAAVAWRTWCGSRAWAVAGLGIYCLGVLYRVATHPPGIGIPTIIIILALINGVRGTFGLHKFIEMNKQEAMNAAAGVTSQPYQAYAATTSVPPPPPPPPMPFEPPE
jgi:hypothetical protein